jgi:hypothetical protein
MRVHSFTQILSVDGEFIKGERSAMIRSLIQIGIGRVTPSLCLLIRTKNLIAYQIFGIPTKNLEYNLPEIVNVSFYSEMLRRIFLA